MASVVALLVRLAKLLAKRPELNISIVSEAIGCHRQTLTKYLRCIGALVLPDSTTTAPNSRQKKKQTSKVVVPSESIIAQLCDAIPKEILNMRDDLRHSVSQFVDSQENSSEQAQVSTIVEVRDLTTTIRDNQSTEYRL